MSPNKENYLKTIYELNYDFTKITNKRISEIMNVSAPSVTEMLNALSGEGYLTHSPYNKIVLTPKGNKVSEKLVKTHRLWEVFLNKCLKYPVDNVHHNADALEHSSDDDLIEHLNDFLGHPQRCPHGGIIPGNGQGETDADDKLLSMIPDNTKVQIVRVSDNYDFLQYFGSLNLEIDDTITVLKHEKFDNSLVVEKDDGSKLTIGAKAIDYIFVELR
ncbi:metal-dependent transcriptional regulator [Companilactobacillus bobalius]|uniref:Manganese transport regulator n=2 Tax=Companilactobacillus bobalius TaxID=2801451 RepID=A0A202FDS8_9LACO|nr:metal-dependent transcriptional regulator [Companilactobacillus bobalius]KAE9556966.1 iron-dependent repressor [Companilactobacillus bobalius]KRK81888.1 Iron-dependent repressor [Companilactobacillus bobalius DSM 19674]OVE98621.1 Diphtheria toxin repressor [Companilactobacillus bobalius]GEO59044.1 Cro/Cl family transcriptional regulator [Companilactobacillus paralimentarius]